MFAVYPPIAASEARLFAANSRGNKKNRAAVETYDCKHCNRSFNKQYNLLIHERSHEKSENQTLFNCNICGKGFRSMNNMKNHRLFFWILLTRNEKAFQLFFAILLIFFKILFWTLFDLIFGILFGNIFEILRNSFGILFWTFLKCLSESF